MHTLSWLKEARGIRAGLQIHRASQVSRYRTGRCRVRMQSPVPATRCQGIQEHNSIREQSRVLLTEWVWCQEGEEKKGPISGGISIPRQTPRQEKGTNDAFISKWNADVRLSLPNCSSILDMAVLRGEQCMLQAQHRGESPGGGPWPLSGFGGWT